MGNTPNIRFKGFDEDWEQRKVFEYASCLTGNGLNWNDISDDGEQECILYGNLYTDYGMIADSIVYRTNTEVNNPVYSKFGDVLIPASDTTPTGLARATSLEKSGVLIGGDINIIRPNEGINGSCLSLVFNANKKELIRLIKGTTVRHIHNSDIKNITVCLPKIEEEQVMISSCFKQLDHLITLYQHKCQETKKFKEYMLQKMFPKKGEKIPEIRFEGFTGDWEQRKFGEITELKSASRVHKDEWTSNGVPFFRSSDVMATINGTENEKAFISEELYEKLSKVSGKLEEGDILVTGGGSVGNPYIVPDNKPLYTKDADLLWIKNKGKFHPYFLYEFFFSPTFRNYLGSISHVGTIAHYTITQLSDTPICLPSFEEQKEVGEYFQSIDHLITLHQCRVRDLTELKKYMLQNMFLKKGEKKCQN